MMLPVAITGIDVSAAGPLTRPVCEYHLIVEVRPRTSGFLTHPQWHDLALIYSSDRDRTSAWESLDELSKLGPNWDGYDAEPVEPASIANALALLAGLDPETPLPEITPNPNGTLTLDWEAEDESLSLELGVMRFSSFWESRHGTAMKDGFLDTGPPEFVLRALAEMFPEPSLPHTISEGLPFERQGPARFAADRRL